MKTFFGFTAALMVLGVTAGLTLINPLVWGAEYGLKKGWIKARHQNPR